MGCQHLHRDINQHLIMTHTLSRYGNPLALPYSGKKKREGISFRMEEKPISNSLFPPGIRFHPSDEELITYYLQRKVNCLPLPANVIADIELYNYNPWDLPGKAACCGNEELYFFTPRDRKYPNGGRPNRTAASGYWKATGTDKPILSSAGSRRIGVKKALVFYKGKPPKGVKMDWIMTEYRVLETPRPLRNRGSMRLDDWVLCRIRQKGNMSKNAQEDDQNSCEYQEYLTKIPDKLPAVSTNDERDMLADYLRSSEFHLVTSLLTGQDPSIKAINPTASQSSNNNNIKNNRAIHEQRTGKLSNHAAFSLFQSLINSASHQNMHVNFQLPTQMTIDEQRDDYINMQELYLPALMDDFIR